MPDFPKVDIGSTFYEYATFCNGLDEVKSS